MKSLLQAMNSRFLALSEVPFDSTEFVNPLSKPSPQKVWQVVVFGRVQSTYS